MLAHEYGHHIQTITGISGQIRSAQQQNPSRANQLQVLMELQADCYAGVWAGKNRNLIEPGAIEEGMQAAAAIGDDRLSGGGYRRRTSLTARRSSAAMPCGWAGRAMTAPATGSPISADRRARGRERGRAPLARVR